MKVIIMGCGRVGRELATQLDRDGHIVTVLDINPVVLDLGAVRDTVVELINSGTAATGPIQLLADPIIDSAGNVVSGPQLSLSPGIIPTLNPGDTRSVALSLTVPAETPGGGYVFSIWALASETAIFASAAVNFTVSAAAPAAAMRRAEPAL